MLEARMENTTIAAGPQQYSALRVEYQPTALDGLDSTEQSLLDGAINVIARDVEQRCIPVERVSIKRHFSPEDESEELVLTIWVQAPSDIALDYWLTLAGTIAEWERGEAAPVESSKELLKGLFGRSLGEQA
jgi:hypothetical protein